MDISGISTEYRVRKLDENDVDAVYQLSAGNPLYFHYCPPFVTRESIICDMKALPPRTTYDDKFYIGFWKAGKLIAIMDLIFHYPDKDTAFIGLFMMEQSEQGKGVGSALIGECFRFIQKQGYLSIRLAFAKGNPQSEAFWMKNGFEKTGLELDFGNYTAVVMEKELNISLREEQT